MPIGMPGGNATVQQWMDGLKDIPSLFAAHGQQMPQDFFDRSPDEQSQILQQVINQSQKAEQAVHTVGENAKNQQESVQQLQGQGVATNAARKVFNLKKTAQMGQPVDMGVDPAAGMMPPGDPNGQETNPFDGPIQDGGDLKERLLQIDADTAIRLLSEKFTNGQQQVADPSNPNLTGDPGLVIKDAVNQFYETDDPQVQLDAASKLYETILPDGAKAEPGVQDSGVVNTQMETNVKPNTLQSQVLETNEIVRKLAVEHAQARKVSKSFNLSKSAQHQSVHNVLYFGPESTKIDAFTGQLISDWHLVERNKGFGLRIDDVLNIDFEAIWRQSVMDKYSQPYRDKDGKWVGGYIEGRFEVDRNVSPLNDYQLKPGEVRKARPPEQGLTEARMEAARTKMNKDRGYAPADTGEPFNWKEASKKKVTAQVEPLPQLEAPKLPGEPEPKNMAPNPICRICKGNIAKMGQGKEPGVCKNCEARMPNPLQTAPGTNSPGMQNQAVPFNAQLSASRSVFFDRESNKFVVYANAGPRRFDSYEEAEQFNQQPSMPSEDAPDPAEALKAQLPHKQRQVWECADKLAIDG